MAWLRRILWALLAGAALLAAALSGLWWALPDPSIVAVRNPRTTAVVEQRRAEAAARRRPFHPQRRSVPLDAIAPRLVEMVLLSEDAGFWVHGPFDAHEIADAADDTLRRGKKLRGASTITQQLARTVWLGTERSLRRKVEEAVLAVKVHRALPRRRILALYLDTVEWGDGVFGAEAAARHWFGVAASEVDTAQAAVLASMLPAPRRAALAPAPRWLARRSRRLLDRMLALRRIDPGEHARASAELERILAGTSDHEPPATGDPDVESG